MDCRDGRIYSPAQVKAFQEFVNSCKGVRVPETFKHLVPMEIAPTEKQMSRKPPRVGRNDFCPCGSGKKFKHCCWEGAKDAQD